MSPTAETSDPGEGRLAMVAAALSAVGGVQLAFFPIWFGARGLDGREIAVLLAAAPAARIVSNLIGTHLGDRRGDYSRLILLHSFVTALIFAAMGLARGFVALMAGHTALCFVQGPIGPLNDGLVLGEARRRREAGLPPVRLERVRAWGSASALAFMLGCGPVARALPQDALIWIMTVIAGCALVASFFLLRGFEATRAPEPTHRMDDAAPLRRPALLAGIIAAAALVGGSHGFLTVFGSLHWAAQGLDANFIAVAWGVSWVSEVAFFFAANRWFAGERHAGSLMAVGAAGGVLRWALLATDPGPAGVLCAQMLQPLSGAAFSLGPAYLIAELGGRAYTARVHGWLAAATGLSLSASLYASGPLEAAFGQRGYLAMAAMAALGFSISLGIIAATRRGVRPEPKTAAETTAAEMKTDAVP